jgi:hypothetical protein
VRDREGRSARAALRGYDGVREHSTVVIRSVQPIPYVALPAGWDDVEVVDSVLVDEPPRASRAPHAPADARVYDRSGRLAPFQRFGRIVDVVA